MDNIRFKKHLGTSIVEASFEVKEESTIQVEIIQDWGYTKSGIGFTLNKDQIKLLRTFLKYIEED